MNDDALIAHMRARVSQVRRIASMAHDPQMIEMLMKLAEDGEADIDKLEAARDAEPAAEIKIEPTAE